MKYIAFIVKQMYTYWRCINQNLIDIYRTFFFDISAIQNSVDIKVIQNASMYRKFDSQPNKFLEITKNQNWKYLLSLFHVIKFIFHDSHIALFFF